MLIDTHAHLHDREFTHDFVKVLERAAAAEVGGVVLIGEDLENSRTALEHARRAGLPVRMWATVGVHPHKASAWEQSRDQLRELARSAGTVAIGEIGLDYHYDFSPRAAQDIAFHEQMALAREMNLPVVIHCREAYEDVLAICREIPLERRPAGVMHCYFGTPEQAGEFAALGYILGIGGSVTFQKAQSVHETVRQMPVESLVLETDAPYMAPVPHRGKRNEPAYLSLVLDRIARLKGIAPGDVAARTTENARRLFALPLDR